MGQLKVVRREIVIAVAGLAFGLVIILLLASPRLSQPSASNATIGATESFKISFNRSLEPASVPPRFSIVPPIEGNLLLEDNQITFSPASKLAYDQRYTVTVAQGVRSGSGLPTLKTYQASYQVIDPQLIFLKRDGGRDLLWALAPTGELYQLMDDERGVSDFSVMPDGRGLVISTVDKGEGSQIKLLDRDKNRRVLLECRQEQCRFGRWQPGGSLVAFERRPDISGEVGEAEIWLLDTDTGQVRQALGRVQASEIGFEGVAARWSHDGRYLAYFNRLRQVVIIMDTFEDQVTLIPANLEIMAGWSPVENILAYTELTLASDTPELQEEQDDDGIIHDEGELYSHIVIVDVAGERVVDLNAGQKFNFGRAAWHPDGHALAAPRGPSGGNRQIWLVQVPTGDQVLLTEDPYTNHSALSWSPDGRRLAYMGLKDTEQIGIPAIWVLDFETGESKKIADGGFLPGWLP